MRRRGHDRSSAARATLARALLFAALALLGALAGCGDDSSVAPGDSRQAFVRTGYYDVSRSPGLAFVERNDSTLVFERLVDVADPQAAAIIVGADDGGYIGRVRSARRAGTRLAVRIDPAWASDIIVSGEADTTLRLTFGSGAEIGGSPASESDGLRAPLELVEAAPGARLSAGGIELAGVTLLGGAGREGELAVTIERGRIAFEPALDLGFSFTPGGVRAGEAVATGAYAFDVEARIHADVPVSVDAEVVLASMSREVVLRVGDFPVAARVTLRFVATVRLEGNLSPAASWTSMASGPLEFGARWRDGIVRKVQGESIAFEVPAVDLEGGRETRVSIAVWPAFSIEWYGEPSIEASCSVAAEYRAWRGAASVVEWEKLGLVNGAFSFEPGRLARLPRGFEAELHRRETTIASGPFKTDRYIFLREWGRADTAFAYPKGVAVDADGFVYVVDNWSDLVKKFTPEGNLVTSWGGPGSADGRLDAPERIAVDRAGIVYVTDAGNTRVQRFTRDGQHLSTWGGAGTGDGQFLHPIGVAVGDGHVFVADNLAHRVQRFSLEGSYLSQWGGYGSVPGMFDGPAGCAASPAGAGHLIVADCRNNRVQEFALTGAFETAWGSAGTGEGEFDCPIDVAVDAAGNVYVCDLGNDRFQVFSPSGSFITALGSRGAGEGQFDHPEAIAVDAAGRVYIVDGRNARVQVFAPIAP